MSFLRFIPGTSAWRRRRDEELCAQTGERIQEIVDGELLPGEGRDELVRHLEACVRCRQGAESIRELKEAVARVGSAPDEELLRRLHETATQLCEEGDRGFHDAEE